MYKLFFYKNIINKIYGGAELYFGNNQPIPEPVKKIIRENFSQFLLPEHNTEGKYDVHEFINLDSIERKQYGGNLIYLLGNFDRNNLQIGLYFIEKYENDESIPEIKIARKIDDSFYLTLNEDLIGQTWIECDILGVPTIPSDVIGTPRTLPNSDIPTFSNSRPLNTCCFLMGGSTFGPASRPGSIKTSERKLKNEQNRVDIEYKKKQTNTQTESEQKFKTSKGPDFDHTTDRSGRIPIRSTKERIISDKLRKKLIDYEF